jgi:tetratricopeptide (TPR) repeat protein
MKKISYFSLAGLLVLSLAMMMGCAKKPITPESVLDDPKVHYNRGMDLLNRNDLTGARTSFERSKALNPEFAPAYSGLALVDAMSGNFKSAEANYDKALGLDGKCMVCWIAKGRVIARQKSGDWMKDARKAFEKAIELQPNSSEAYYYLGVGYKEAHMFSEAEQAFARVVGFKDDWSTPASEQWDLVKKIVMAAPISEKGREIALIEEIDRADMAVLFMEELKLAELLGKMRPKQYNTGFQAPEDPTQYKPAQTGIAQEPAATDIKGHWAESWLNEIIAIDGMETFPDHTFHPDDKVTRADFAGFIQHIMVLKTNDKSILTRYIGETSHFPDVRSDSWAYNAAMLCVERGILKTKADGSFAPMEHVSGADALLAIRDFQNALRQTF